MPEIRLSPDRTTLSVPVFGRPSESMMLTTDAVDSLIVALIDARAAMLPQPAPGNPAAGAPIRVNPSAAWYIGPTPQGGTVLAVLHPGLGWRGILLNREDEQRLEEATQLLRTRPEQKP